MKLSQYLWAPVETLSCEPPFAPPWHLAVVMLACIVITEFGLQLFLGVHVQNSLLRNLASSISSVELDQVRTFQRLNFFSYLVTSLSVASTWVLTSLFLAGWVIVFEGKLDIRRLLAFNALALFPICAQAMLALSTLLLCDRAGVLSFDPSFMVTTSGEDLTHFAEFIKTSPAILCVTRTAHLAELASAVFIVINVIYTQKLKPTFAVAGVAICYGILAVLQFVAM